MKNNFKTNFGGSATMKAVIFCLLAVQITCSAQTWKTFSEPWWADKVQCVDKAIKNAKEHILKCCDVSLLLRPLPCAAVLVAPCSLKADDMTIFIGSIAVEPSAELHPQIREKISKAVTSVLVDTCDCWPGTDHKSTTEGSSAYSPVIK